LDKPWRWINANSEPLGQWILETRRNLQSGKGIDLTAAPESVSWVQLGTPNDHQKLLEAGRVAPSDDKGSVLIIGDSISPDSQRQFASQIPGAVTVEAVDLRDLVTFARNFDISASDALKQIAEFAQSVMTNVGAADLVSTLLLKGLEAEVVVILNTDGLDARNLYVAMTRGSKNVIICSRSPILNPSP
jgi:DNA helicase-2/ATP-dependent DNA helicase PcrA